MHAQTARHIKHIATVCALCNALHAVFRTQNQSYQIKHAVVG